MEREVSCSGGACSVQRGSFRERAPGNGWREGTRCVRLLSCLSKMVAHTSQRVLALFIPGACIISLVFQLFFSELLCQRDAPHTPTAYYRIGFAHIRLGAWAWLGRVWAAGRPPPAFRVSCR